MKEHHRIFKNFAIFYIMTQTFIKPFYIPFPNYTNGSSYEIPL